VSVVPTIHRLPHGITNSTDFSVRRMSPVSELMRSLGTTRWTPFEARTWKRPRSPESFCTSSVHTPVQLTTTSARTSHCSPVSVSRSTAPPTRSPSRSRATTSVELRTTAPWCAAVRTSVRVCRASSVCAS
jgi:hypothetical protein